MFLIHVVEHHTGYVVVYKIDIACNVNIISKANQLWLCSKIPRLQIYVFANSLKIVFFLQVLSS